MRANLNDDQTTLMVLNPTVMEAMLRQTMERLLKDHAPPHSEVDFHLIDPDPMAEMNEQYLHHDGPTDVITFSYLDDDFPDMDEAPTIGEIFVCPAVAQTAADDLGCLVHEEVILYLVHGILHLSGLDDVSDQDRLLMREAEAKEMAHLKQEFDLVSPFSAT